MSPSPHSIVDAVVVHRRLRPRVNAFRYRVPYLCLSVGSLDSGTGRSLKIDKAGLVSFQRKDHGRRDGSDLVGWVRDILRSHDLAECRGGEILLMTLPRLLGFVFNPVSFWFCHDEGGALRAVLCEVNNTFGESHCYLVHHPDRRAIAPDDWIEGRKVFHVSPFLPTEGTYRFRFRMDERKPHVDIHYHDKQGVLLVTSVGGLREPLDDRLVWRRFIVNPTATLAVVARIHWQALRLWRSRTKFYRKPVPPTQLVTR